ncbi:MAG: hypothetical protein ACHQ2Y_10330 [Candidatus Lutacidiplasmatales archaeon]
MAIRWVRYGDSAEGFRLAGSLRGAKVWTDFSRWLETRFASGHFPLPVDPLPLLSQAATAYDVGALEASTLACRAAVESFGYLFLTRRWNGNGWSITLPALLDGTERRVDFDEIRRALVRRRVLDQKTGPAMARIQNTGNFSAHLSSAVDHRRSEALKKFMKALAEGRSSSGRFDTSLTQTEALQNLEDAAEIVKQLLEAAERGAITAGTERHGQESPT